MTFTPSRNATRLVRAAERMAIGSLEDRPATRIVLDELAHRIHRAILAQVLSGQWSEFDVRDIDELAGLVVTTRLNPGLIGPKILIEYDFVRTKLPTFIVSEKRV